MTIRLPFSRQVLLAALLSFLTPLVAQAELLPDLFKKTPLELETWREGEQYVGLAAQDAGAVPNQHPAKLDVGDVRDALRSLELWEKGGLLRDEQSRPVFTQGQAETLGRYLPEALGRARQNQDALFVVRGYGSIALDTLKEREWTSGRAFVVDGKLNLIIGSFKIKKDRGKRNAEASYGVLNDYSDLYFDTGTRRERSAKMPGKVVSSVGISFAGGDGGRPDWIIIDVVKAAVAYREGLVPEDEKKREQSARQEAAKLTLERRQMREEMARLRQELKELKSSGGASAQSVEDRLATLQELKTKALISEEEYRRRRDEILGDI